MYKVEIQCPNLRPFHSIFMVRRSGIICGPIWGHFPSEDHLRLNLGIISGPGIICGPGSFVGLSTSTKFFKLSFYECMVLRNKPDIVNHKKTFNAESL